MCMKINHNSEIQMPKLGAEIPIVTKCTNSASIFYVEKQTEHIRNTQFQSGLLPMAQVYKTSDRL